MDIITPSANLSFDENQLAAIEAAKNIVSNLQAESVRLAKLVQIHETDVKEAVAAKDALDAEFEATGALLEARKAELAATEEAVAGAKANLDTTYNAHKALLEDMELRKAQADEREGQLDAQATEQAKTDNALSIREKAVIDEEAELERKVGILNFALASL